MANRDWKPRRRGAIYCSPACGGDCTYASYRNQRRKALALAKRTGRGWKPRVWENLGWHYSIQKGKNEIHDFGSHFWFNGGTTPQIMGEGKTPQAAIRDALKKARALIAAVETAARGVADAEG